MGGRGASSGGSGGGKSDNRYAKQEVEAMSGLSKDDFKARDTLRNRVLNMIKKSPMDIQAELRRETRQKNWPTDMSKMTAKDFQKYLDYFHSKGIKG